MNKACSTCGSTNINEKGKCLNCGAATKTRRNDYKPVNKTTQESPPIQEKVTEAESIKQNEPSRIESTTLNASNTSPLYYEENNAGNTESINQSTPVDTTPTVEVSENNINVPKYAQQPQEEINNYPNAEELAVYESDNNSENEYPVTDHSLLSEQHQEYIEEEFVEKEYIPPHLRGSTDATDETVDVLNEQEISYDRNDIEETDAVDDEIDEASDNSYDYNWDGFYNDTPSIAPHEADPIPKDIILKGLGMFAAIIIGIIGLIYYF